MDKDHGLIASLYVALFLIVFGTGWVLFRLASTIGELEAAKRIQTEQIQFLDAEVVNLGGRVYELERKERFPREPAAAAK